MIWIVGLLFGCLFAFVAQGAIREHRAKVLARQCAQIGDIWEYVGGDIKRPAHRDKGGIYVVVAANANREAGPDSWAMRQCRTGRVLYMHHRDHADDWILCMRDGWPMRSAREVRRSLAALPVLLVLSISGCHPSPTVTPPTGDDCTAACSVLAQLGCEEGASQCVPRCERLSAVGYVWTSEQSGPKCVRMATTLEGVRACRVRCEQ